MTATGFLVFFLSTSTLAGEGNYLQVKPIVFDSEKKRVPDIWVLDFIYRKPRYIKADIPGKGEKVVMYMTYKIVNNTGEDRLFVPQFTLVTREGKVYHDVVLPRAEKSVMLREDPSQPLLNSVTIAQKIPASQPDAVPIVRTGVAFFENVDPNTRGFTIYVTGLSNGYVKTFDKQKNEEVMRRKTLKIDFYRPGDERDRYEEEIEARGEPEWVYR